MLRALPLGLLIAAATLPAPAGAATLYLNCTLSPVQSEIWILDFDKSVVSSKYFDEVPTEFSKRDNYLAWRSTQFGFEYLLNPETMVLTERDGDGVATYRCRKTDRRP